MWRGDGGIESCLPCDNSANIVNMIDDIEFYLAMAVSNDFSVNGFDMCVCVCVRIDGC